jgi:hypothetical protein
VSLGDVHALNKDAGDPTLRVGDRLVDEVEDALLRRLARAARTMRAGMEAPRNGSPER